MKKYVFESLKFFCAAILCVILSAFTSPSWGALPDGYTELQYIESTGTQYIDTGITPTANTSFDMKANIVSTLGNTFIGLLYSGNLYNSSDTFGISFSNSKKAIAGYKGTEYNIYVGENNVLTEQDFIVSFTPTDISVTRLSAEYSDTKSAQTTVTNVTRSLYLFSGNSDTVDLQKIGDVKVYYLKIYDGSTLVRDFVPAKNASGVVGMYDTVNNRFYENAGSGSFIAGPNACDGTIVNYTSATGTGVQNGTPTPTNPIEPVFYQQGNMVLRKVGDYADSYDATTGKITRRVGVKVLDGTEDWVYLSSSKKVFTVLVSNALLWKSQSGCLSNAFACTNGVPSNYDLTVLYLHNSVSRLYIGFPEYDNNVDGFKQYLAQQYANGTPITIYYPLAEETTEDWPASYCETPIKIATTKYNESAFGPLNTALQNAISVVDTVVSNTITQAGRIATLQTQKQTRPDETCPAGKKCLLVEDASGILHWYEIVENAWDLPVGYSQLQYIRSDGASWIDTGITGTQDTAIETKFINLSSDSSTTVLIGDGWSNGSYLLSIVASTSAPNRIGGLNNTLRDFWRTGQEFVVKMDKTGLYVNNSKINWNGSATNFTTTKPLYLLGDPAASGRNSYAMLYYMKIYNNGTLVRDFVPAKNASGVVGMYDTVNNRFYTNAGTGEFVAGPVAE